MPTISVDVEPAIEHVVSTWVHEECCRFYVAQRRLHCNYLEILDLWLRVPVCADCIQSDPLECRRLPDIRPERWQEDLLFTLGKSELDEIQMLLLKDSRYAFVCQRCGRSLRPWDGDEVHVLNEHIEERYSIPLETGDKRHASEQLRERVMNLYGNVCFKCGATNAETQLHIDHIRPQSKGGDAALRNLQPLCEVCGQEKADTEPSERTIYGDIYFGPQPSDGYEGLFW